SEPQDTWYSAQLAPETASISTNGALGSARSLDWDRMMADDPYSRVLSRIAAALERLAPTPRAAANLSEGDAFVWHAEEGRLEAVERVNRIDIALLQGIDQVRDILLDNTRRFARGLPANNALLWGARGMGKSSLVKAVHAAINRETGGMLALVEIH